METKANYVLIGAFTLAGFLGMLGFLMWFARLEVNRQFEYYDVYFDEVLGLSVSSQVLFAGLSVGKVVSMDLSPGSQRGVVRVRLELAEDTPVRVDSRASVDTSAVTGISTILITPGGRNSDLLRENPSEEGNLVIRSSRSPLQTLGQEAPELIARLNLTAERLNHLLSVENIDRVSQILGNVEAASNSFQDAMADVSRATDAVGSAAGDFASFGADLTALSEAAKEALVYISAASEGAVKTLATADRYIGGDLTVLTGDLTQTSEAVRGQVQTLGGEAEVALGKLDGALESARVLFDAGNEVVADLRPVFADLRQTLAGLDKALANLPEDVPQISAGFREAAESAAAAFDDLRDIMAGSRVQIEAFTRQGLPQYTRLGHEVRQLVENINQFVTHLKRNPAQILRGAPTPEFRR